MRQSQNNNSNIESNQFFDFKASQTNDSNVFHSWIFEDNHLRWWIFTFEFKTSEIQHFWKYKKQKIQVLSPWIQNQIAIGGPGGAQGIQGKPRGVQRERWDQGEPWGTKTKDARESQEKPRGKLGGTWDSQEDSGGAWKRLEGVMGRARGSPTAEHRPHRR